MSGRIIGNVATKAAAQAAAWRQQAIGVRDVVALSALAGDSEKQSSQAWTARVTA